MDISCSTDLPPNSTYFFFCSRSLVPVKLRIAPQPHKHREVIFNQDYITLTAIFLSHQEDNTVDYRTLTVDHLLTHLCVDLQSVLLLLPTTHKVAD